ncbi:MAG: ABC transporter permease [Planctomycetes bacterium]|nr:ABC transporter permease [Planctomycetota bacterium]
MSAEDRSLARAARPLLALVLLALASPWLASDQPLWVRGASRAAWERCEERLVRALQERDAERFAAARAEALGRLLVEEDELARSLAALDLGSLDAAERWSAGERALAPRRPELRAERACSALELERPLLDLALEPALRRLPPAEELRAFAERLERSGEELGGGELAAAVRAVAAEARELAQRGERRLSLSSSQGSWRALRDGLDRWRGASAAGRRALLGVRERPSPELRSHSAWPVLARAGRLEVLLWGGLGALALAGAVGWLRRLAPRSLSRGARPRGRRVFATLLLGALAALAFHGGRSSAERELDYRGEIAAGSFALESAWMAAIAFGPEHARGEPAELPPCAAQPTWIARGGRAPQRDLAPAPGAWRRHPFGTDALGRDVFARVLHGARLSLLIGLLGALAAGSIGIALGVAAGGCGGVVDALVRRAIEVLSCFPPLLFALALAAMRGPSSDTAEAVAGIVFVLVFARWTFLARVARAEVLRVRAEPYVEAARALGVGAVGRLVHHVLPQIVPALLVVLSAELAAAMVFESALSFLGLGLAEPSASFGGVLRGALQAPSAWWLALFPGLALLAAVLSVHRLGEAFASARGRLPR